MASVPGWLKGEPRFDPGTLTVTPGARDVLRGARTPVESLVARHASGDWGELPDSDRHASEGNLLVGGHVFSAYVLDRFPLGLGRDRVWVCSLIRERWTYVCLEAELRNVL